MRFISRRQVVSRLREAIRSHGIYRSKKHCEHSMGQGGYGFCSILEPGFYVPKHRPRVMASGLWGVKLERDLNS